MKIRLLALVPGLLFSHSVFATTLRPHACPSLAAIHGLQFQQAVSSSYGWAASVNGNFSTEESWTFTIFSKNAKNQQEAVMEANRNVKLLSYVQGPWNDGGKQWMCLYSNKDATISGGAVTPPKAIHMPSPVNG